MHPHGCGVHNTTRRARAFSLVDVLVSIGVITVLVALLLPSLAHIRESTRRVICQSNLRQVGIGVAQYADENDDFLPPSQFYEPDSPANGLTLAEMMTLRVGPDTGQTEGDWDGLGLLYFSFQLRAPEIFYCPSHYGDHAFQTYAEPWRNDGGGDIIGNYHYRGIGPNNAKRLRSVEPVRAALVTDGMRTARDVNHRVGMNVLRADLSVSWFQDRHNEILAMLASSAPGEPNNNATLTSVWRVIDRPNSTLSGGNGGSGVGN